MRSNALRLFCLVIVLPPLLAVLGAIFLAQSDWFLRRAVPKYLAMLNDEFSIRNRPCAVLLFGDSAALTGLAPWAIAQQTGAETCSIAQTKGVVGVTGLDALRDYLARNPPPSVLVIAFAPEDWRPIRNWGETAYVEGMLEMARHDGAANVARRFAAHPNEVFGFATFVWKSAAGAVVRRGPAAGPAIRDGQMTLDAPPEAACLNQDAANLQRLPEVATPQPEFVRAVRQEFSARAASLLLVAPDVPDCDALAGYYSAALNPLLDAPLATQPIGHYNDLDRHFTAAGAEEYSRRIAGLISAKLRHSATVEPSHAF